MQVSRTAFASPVPPNEGVMHPGLELQIRITEDLKPFGSSFSLWFGAWLSG